LSPLAASASLKDGTLTVTLSNGHMTDALDTVVRLSAGRAAEVDGVLLAHADVRAHNTFEEPEAVKPREMEVEAEGDEIPVNLPAGSVARLSVKLR
jgi:alpha-N-arabinofuranosidase